MIAKLMIDLGADVNQRVTHSKVILSFYWFVHVLMNDAWMFVMQKVYFLFHFFLSTGTPYDSIELACLWGEL